MVTQVVAKRARKSTATELKRHVSNAVRGTLGLSGERMSKVDTAWLRMDDPSNLMMIVGVWITKPGVAYQDVCRRIEERLLRYPRFGWCVVQDAAGATWVRDRDFRIEKHVVLERLSTAQCESEQQALQRRLAELAVRPLDMARPLWQFHLVENYQGGSALMVRIHHCIADGIALISVTQSLVDDGIAPPDAAAGTSSGNEFRAPEDWIVGSVVKPLAEVAVKALGVAGDGAVNALEMIGEPRRGVDKGMAGSADLARLAYQVLRDGAALAVMTDDSPTRLKGIPGLKKNVAWCQPIALDEVRAVGKALGCSINDVLLSCVAGAIGQYLQSLGDSVANQEIRAMVPVNLRAMEDAHKLGNRFGLAPVILPIGVANPVARVYAVRRRMTELKGSLQPALTFALLAVAGMMIKPAQDAMLGLFSRKTTAVMTNVPGPREKLKFCGSTLEQSLFWVPQSGTVGLGVSILSYGGGVQFGIISDAGLCPDPQKIIDEFEPEFAKLATLTLMLPWGE